MSEVIEKYRDLKYFMLGVITLGFFSWALLLATLGAFGMLVNTEMATAVCFGAGIATVVCAVAFALLGDCL